MDRPNMDRCFSKEPDWVTREIAGETIVVPVRKHVGEVNAIYSLNDMGTEIWKLMNDRTRVRQVVDEICNAYDVTLEEATADIVDFLRTLEAEGMIKEKDK